MHIKQSDQIKNNTNYLGFVEEAFNFLYENYAKFTARDKLSRIL